MQGYDVVAKVADGTAVEAFLAQSSLGRVLVQVSRPELVADPVLFDVFTRRVLRLTALHHPSVLGARKAELGKDNRYLLVSDPVTGLTAADWLKRFGAIPPAEVRRWMLGLCEGLSFLHFHGLVHGNLAPSSVFLERGDAGPSPRLLDTSYLLFRGGPHSFKVPGGSPLVGAAYLSPERVAGERAGVASDVYGLGVLMYELLTGGPPFLGPNAAATRALHVTGPLPNLKGAAARFDAVVRRCLAKVPGERFATVAEVRAALDALGALEVPIVGEPPTPPVAVVQPGNGPTQLGPWRIEQLIGEGGMGRVYLASHEKLERKAAIKVLKTDLATHPSLVQRFLVEARAVNRVKHPNIVEVYDFVEEPERVYFVMELLQGKSLKRTAAERPVELKRAVGYLRSSAQALAMAHEASVLHRDVKPDNIFIAEQDGGREKVKVLDFGVARIKPHGAGPIPRTTVAGQSVGTPLWMAPELLRGLDADVRADIYGLGLTLYVVLKRHFPWEGQTEKELIQARMHSPPLALGGLTFLGEAVPQALHHLVMGCLDMNREGRPTSMHEVAQALTQVEAALDAVTEDVTPRRSFWWRR